MEDYRKRVESAEEGTRPVPQADQHHGPSHPSDHGPKTQSRQQDLPPGLPRQAYQATQETPRDPQLQIRVVCESAPAQPDQPAQTVTAQQTPNINNTNNQNNTPASQQVGPNHARNKRLRAARKQNQLARLSRAEGEVTVIVQAPTQSTPNTNQTQTQGNEK